MTIQIGMEEDTDNGIIHWFENVSILRMGMQAQLIITHVYFINFVTSF